MKAVHQFLKQPFLLKVIARSFGIILLGFIPLRLAIAYHQAPDPQMIVMLGGGTSREKFAAEFAQLHPDLKLWISTGTTEVESIFQAADVPRDRLILDWRARDTVTNFTTLVSDLRQQGVHHVYVITCDFHQPRAIAIATVVLGSQGIAFTPIAAPSPHPGESPHKIVRDVGRSLLWLMTGRTGASWGRRFLTRF